MARELPQLPLAGLLAFAIIGSIALGIVVARHSGQTVDRIAEREYDQQADDVVSRAVAHLQTISQAAKISAAMLPSNADDLSATRWQGIAQSLRSQTRLNEVLRLAMFVAEPLSVRKPVLIGTTQPWRVMKTTFVEEPKRDVLPESPTEAQTFTLSLRRSAFFTSGSDVSFSGQVSRPAADYSAALLARDTGKTIMAVPRDDTDNMARGVDLYVPLFARESVWSVQDRARHFSGVLVVHTNLREVLTHLEDNGPAMLLRASSGIQTFYQYESPTERRFEVDPSLHRVRVANIFGQEWRFEIQGSAVPEILNLSRLPELSVMAVAFCCLLFCTVAGAQSLIRRRQDKCRLVEHAALSGKLVGAERANADLESFAYIVSHDLRTPLRGLFTLSELLLEEVDDLVRGESTATARGGVSKNESCEPSDSERYILEYVSRMQAQLERMDGLVKGIHQYSTLGAGNEKTEKVDTCESINNVASSLDVNDSRFTLNGSFPVLQTYRIRFEQTLANLVGNAFKYHHDPRHANVSVSVSSYGDYFSFAVTDDGPGIDPENHDRIFNVFESIRDEATEGSGVGLSIVKKAVEGLGGVVTVESTMGVGTTFKFLWPRVSPDEPAEMQVL